MHYDCGNDSVGSFEDFDSRQTFCPETNSISSDFDDRRSFMQWRTVRVCKVFSEYPRVSEKYFFEKAYSCEA